MEPLVFFGLVSGNGRHRDTTQVTAGALIRLAERSEALADAP